ncbi:MAG: hypothetical protein U0T75_14600 [Chitinophagales bacterium]
MTSSVSVHTIFNCSLERAFKTPILCDVTKVHTGLLVMPAVTHCEGDAGWGQPGSSKKVFVAKSLTQPGGFASVDKVLERRENEYWKIEVSNFQAWMLSFTRFVGEWKVTELAPNKIQVDYTYTMHSDSALLYPFCWLFTKIFWRVYMNQVTGNIRKMAYTRELYQFP